MKNTFSSILLVVLVMTCINSIRLASKSQLRTSTSGAKVNVIVNGGFENPNLNGSTSILDSIEGWTADNKIEIGRGSVYIADWGTTQVCELDVYENTTIQQTFKLLDKCSCVLNFKWAARTGNQSSSFVVNLNGDKVFKVVPKDDKIHSESFNIKTVAGDNTISFTGKGKSDSLGATIDDVEVLCDESLVPVPVVPGPAEVDECA
jgi:hypothetical protein